MNRSKIHIAEILMLICFVAIFAVWAYAGTFTRLIADDYCTASIYRLDGFIGSITTWYYGWAGQYTNWTLKGIIHGLGEGAISILPLFLLAAWFLLAGWALYPLLKLLRLRKPLYIAYLMGSLIVFAVFAGVPNIIQSLYWFAASVPYTLPLILFTGYVGYFIRVLQRYSDKPLPRTPIVLTTLLTFLLGGLSEVYTVFQGAVFALAAVGFYWFAPPQIKQNAIKMLGIGVICSIIAAFILLTAPGTAVRQAEYADRRLPITEVIYRVMYVSFSYIATAIGIFTPIPVIITLFFSAIIGYFYQPFENPWRLSSRQVQKLLLLSLGILFVIVVSCIGPPVYATAVAPPGRAYIMPHFALIVTTAFWGMLMGMTTRQKPNPNAELGLVTKGLFVALIVFGPILFAGRAITQLPTYQKFAAEHDVQSAEIQLSAHNGIEDAKTVMLETDLGRMAALDPIGEDPTKFVNRCAARYYGVQTLTARTPLQMADKTG